RKFTKFLIATLTEFFDRTSPLSSAVKPACMKNTSTALTSSHATSTVSTAGIPTPLSAYWGYGPPRPILETAERDRERPPPGPARHFRGTRRTSRSSGMETSRSDLAAAGWFNPPTGTESHCRPDRQNGPIGPPPPIGASASTGTSQRVGGVLRLALAV